MAISSSGSAFPHRRSDVQLTTCAAHRLDIAGSLDWNQALLDQSKIHGRANLRPETAASIRAAQNVWLAAQDTQPALMPAQEAELDVEAFIMMLVKQASEAKTRI